MKLRTTVFLVVVLVVELFYALWNPPYNYPDERSHLQHVAFWRDEGRMPDPYTEREKIQQDKHPPYAYVLGAGILRLTEGWFTDEASRIRLPGPYELAIQPGRPQRVRVDEASLPVRDGQLLVLRAFMVLHWCLLAFFLLELADLCFPERPRFAASLAWSCALIPQAALSGAAFTPDTPLVAFCAGAFYFATRAGLGQGTARGAGLRTGALLGLALLAKSAAVYLLPVLLLAALLRARRRGDGREALHFFLWACLVPIVVAGWWYGRNLILYGDLFQMRAQIEAYTHSVRREPLTGTFFEAFFWDLFRTFFGFSDRSVLLPQPVYFVLAAIGGVAGIGLLLLVRRPVREEVSPPALRALPFALLGFAVMLGLAAIGNLTVPSAQGRYLFPALGPVLVLLGAGLQVGARLRRDSRLAYVLAACWIVFGLWAFHWAVLRRQGVQRARAAGELQVIYYEDCGSPGLHPHLVPGHGYEAPDEGQLGRIVAWRTLTGHDREVLYRFPLAPADRGDLQVRVTYFNPDPTTPYVAYASGRFQYTSQRLFANGILLHDEIEVTSTPTELVFPLAASVVAGGSLDLRFEKVSGIAAVVSEIWIERPWLQLGAGRVVHNRTGRTLPCVVLFARGSDEGMVQLSLPAHGSEPLAGRVPEDADRLQLLLGELSPWMRREAEAHPGQGTGVRWLGDMAASGGYRMYGDGVLAALPFASDLRGPQRFLARVRDGGGWHLRTLEPVARDGAGVLHYRSEGPESLDYVLLIGGWRQQ